MSELEKALSDIAMKVGNGIADSIVDGMKAAQRDTWERTRVYCVSAVTHPDNHEDLICYDDGANLKKPCDFDECPLLKGPE